MSVVYPITSVKSEVTFFDENLDEHDPDVITCTVVLPDGTETVEDYSDPSTFPPIGITRVSIGLYRLKYDATMDGVYSFVWYGEVTDGPKITTVASIRITSTDQGS